MPPAPRTPSAEALRRLNLLAILEDDHPAVRAPPPGAGDTWTEDELRAHYAGGGQVGGAAAEPVPPPGPATAPPGAAAAVDAGSAASYRRAAAAHGIPPRRSGLFPRGDALLAALASAPGAWPFEKLLPADGAPHVAPAVCWASGESAAAAGLDLRLFYVPPPSPSTPSSIETVLDEATAEAAKVEVSHLVSTIDIHFKIARPVPLHTTLEVEARVVKVAGVKATVSGCIKDPATGVELASCVAVLADLVALRRAGV